MKTGENWRKSDTNLSLWEPRLRCPALKADGMRTAELGCWTRREGGGVLENKAEMYAY